MATTSLTSIEPHDLHITAPGREVYWRDNMDVGGAFLSGSSDFRTP